MSLGARGSAIVPMRYAHAAAPVSRGAAILLQVHETAKLPSRTSLFKAAAIAVNGALFAVGVYFEMHPRDRHDVWSAGGVAAVAVLNSAAVTVPFEPGTRRFVKRVRRIALFANRILVPTALALVVLEALHDVRHAGWHGAALLIPPLVTLQALRDAMTAEAGPRSD